MFNATKAIPPREMAKWCAYTLVLLAPGSFVVLPLLWLGRRWVSRGSRLATLPHRGMQ
jgi:hypothetical protein